MFRERSEEIKYALILLDFFLTLLAYAVAFSLRFFIFDPGLSDFKGLDHVSYLFFGLLLAVSQVIIFGLLGLYSPRRFLSFLGEIGVVLGGLLLNIFFSISILYFMRIYQVSRILPILYGAAILIFVLAGHNLFRRLILRRRKAGRDLKDVIIIGSGPMAERTAKVVESDKLFGLRVLGYIEEQKVNGLVIPEKRLGRIGDLDSLIQRYNPSYLIYAGESDSHENLKAVLDICDSHGIHLQIVPSYSELITVNGQIENHDGLPIISIRDIPSRLGLNRVLKRSFDLLFSGLFILVFSPVYILIALAVKLTSRGPVFFSQERVGLDNRIFKIIKFRTMKVQEKGASATIWTTKNDPRITPIGRFLRKSSLDEAPQFFNIFAGRMSVVGPRPERPFYVEQFKDKYRFFKRRHAVKAGLTGWAQINGLRGDTSIQQRIDADIFYIENWSLAFDLKIVVLTPFRGMIHKNAY
jgi:Undecaprenyl-phosphate glucose phosphotransferase